MCFFIKWILKKIRCSSQCTYNEQLYDETILTRPLHMYELKNKDLLKIGYILNKRSIKKKPLKINIEI